MAIRFLNTATFTSNVGIGVTSNSAGDTNNGVPKLQVGTTTAVLGEFPLAARFTTNSDAGDNSGVSVLINSGNDRGLMISAGRQSGNVAKVTLNVVENNGTELSSITILQNGSGGTSANVGIRTDNPSSQLSIGANALTTKKPTVAIVDGVAGGSLLIRGLSPILSFDKTGTGVPKILMDSGGVQFKTGTLDAEGDIDMVILPNGNVGIGTDTPGEKLDVNGRVRIGDINYAYGGSNYHILLAEDSNDAYISNINGYGILSAGGYYYGANFRKLNSTSTAYSGIQTRPDGTIIFESATGGTAGDTISATEKMRISSNGSIQFAAYNSSNNIGTATYLLGTDVSGNVVKTSAAPSANFNQGAKTHTVGTAFSNVLTVALSSHQGCYVTLCCFGDWGGHSSAAYRGEFFLQNGAGIYNEPGIIIRQDDNTSDGTDQIICQILDPGGSTGSRDFIIQIRHTDTTSPANFTGTITFTVQGQFNSVT